VRKRAIAAWAFAGLVFAVAAASLALALMSDSGESPAWLVALCMAAVLAPTAVGTLLALRRPENPIGWLLVADGLILALCFLADGYADYAVLGGHDLPAPRWAALASDIEWPLFFAGPVAIAFVFPDGRLPSRRWRSAAAVGIAGFAAIMLAVTFTDEPFTAPYENVVRPVPALPGLILGLVWLVGMLGILFALVAAVAALRVRYRRGSVVERSQILWLAYAGLLIPSGFVFCVFLQAIGDIRHAAMIPIVLTHVGMAAAVGIAVLRYRLYDIDRVVNRTLVYGALTALLGGAWAATVVLLGVALGRGSAWATAGATLVAAVAFRPARAWIQNLVDRRFDRRRYDAVRQVEAFLRELREDRAAPEGVRDVLARALGDPGLEVAFWLPESGVHADAEGATVEPRAGPGRVITPVTRGGAPLGVVVHDAALAEHPNLLETVLHTAGLAIEIARLRVELRRQLAEVELSRARIVVAGYEERRRIERDLHDGAQQRLVTVGLALRHLQHDLPPSSNGLGPGLDEAVTEVGAAIADLRELARGVRPTLLDEGLEPALRQLAGRCPVPAVVDVTGDRVDPDIEAAAYFVASEALTNAVKHAKATRIALRASHADGRLTVTVGDDGCGGAVASPNSGLAGLADRVAAHGGRLEVTSPPQCGTTITAELPCGW
jgi:signal transduction histidine kinase